jgi:hypothetical protein
MTMSRKVNIPIFLFLSFYVFAIFSILSGNENVARVIAQSGAKIRSQPNLKSEKLKVLNFGTEVSILSKSKNQDSIEGVSDYWYKIKDGNIEGWVFGGLLQISELTTQVQLAESLKHPVSQKKSWADIGIFKDQVDGWEKNGFTPDTAKDWKQNGISPFEAHDWLERKVSYEEVNLWKQVGASPYSYSQHLENGVNINVLKAFIAADINQISDIEICVELKIMPEEAKQFRSAKLILSNVKELMANGLTKSEIKSWVELGFDGLDILETRKGFEVNEAKAWFESGIDRYHWKDWKESGFSPAEAKIWIKNGFDFSEAERGKVAGRTPDELLKEREQQKKLLVKTQEEPIKKVESKAQEKDVPTKPSFIQSVCQYLNYSMYFGLLLIGLAFPKPDRRFKTGYKDNATIRFPLIFVGGIISGISYFLLRLLS